MDNTITTVVKDLFGVNSNLFLKKGAPLKLSIGQSGQKKGHFAG